jgi:hypothetical protein
MKHKIYDRILYDTYIKLNTGLDSLHDNWGYGCPLGMSPITFEEMEYDRNKWNVKKFNKLRICIEDYLYKNEEAHEKFLESIDYAKRIGGFYMYKKEYYYYKK